jgi:hypothetical protein
MHLNLIIANEHRFPGLFVITTLQGKHQFSMASVDDVFCT